MDSALLFPLKAGELPAYATFVRQVWFYMEHGDSALCPPPDMFTLPLDDDEDVRVVGREAARCLLEFCFAEDRIIAMHQDGHVRVIFRDLEVLYTFLRLMSQRAAEGEKSAREVVTFALSMLGFRLD